MVSLKRFTMYDKETLFIQLHFAMYAKETLLIQTRFTMYDKETLFKAFASNARAFFSKEKIWNKMGCIT